MPTYHPVLETDLPLPNKRRGKVRDVYDCTTTSGQEAILLVATDRLSAFDVIMPNAPAYKGVILTQMATFWFKLVEAKMGDRVDTHLISTDPADIAGLNDAQRAQLEGRVMIGKKTDVVPIECVARGYLAGSGWKEYQQNQSVCGVALPEGLMQCSKLPAPIFTPATKAQVGDHDENISFERACALEGEALVSTLRELTLELYQLGHDYAAQRGIILADTKFEFGLQAGSDKPILIDEILTPDSSRYWPADQYEAGRDQASFDKQIVRNYLEDLYAKGEWNKAAPGPVIPQDVLDGTMAKYNEAYEKLTGTQLAY